jgi:hypothetical protein
MKVQIVTAYRVSHWQRYVRGNVTVCTHLICALLQPRYMLRHGFRKFSAPVQTDPGAHPSCYTIGTESFPGVNRPGREVEHPPPSGTEVKEIVRAIPLLPL